MGDLYEELYMCTPPGYPEENEKPNIANENSGHLLPAKSKDLYENAYKRFEKYMLERGVSAVTETIMIDYMAELSKRFKSSSLWSNYSMLKGTLNLSHNIDISKFFKLRAFLKQQNIGYKAKKCKIFTKSQFRRFLRAPDKKYLMHKVAFIFGVAGACRRQELTYLTLDNIEDLGKAILIKLDNRTDKPRSFVVTGKYMELYRKYASLRPSGVVDNRFFLSYRDGKCTRQVVGINRFGSIPQEIAFYLKLPDAKDYTGRCFRAVSPTFLGDGEEDLLPYDDEYDNVTSSQMMILPKSDSWGGDSSLQSVADVISNASLGAGLLSPKRDESWDPSTVVAQSYINDSVDIKTEIDDDTLNDFSSDMSTTAENDNPETSKLTSWIATDAAIQENPNVVNISSATSSTIDWKGLTRPIVIENCSKCTITINMV